MELASIILLLIILVILVAILNAMKSGFNEVIRGLEALERRSGEKQ
jgi:hypothetical protein